MVALDWRDWKRRPDEIEGIAEDIHSPLSKAGLRNKSLDRIKFLQKHDPCPPHIELFFRPCVIYSKNVINQHVLHNKI